MHNIFRDGVRSAACLLGTALLVGLTTSCSSSSTARAYAVPDDVCGTKVTKSVLEPLLPEGQTISAQPTSAIGVKRCRFVVDEKIVFSSSTERHGADTTARDVASSAYGVEPTDTPADGGYVIYSRTGAVSLVKCPAGSSDSSVWATVRTEHDVKASDMRRFIEAYATAVAKGGACRSLDVR
ncbi:hypothetical protein GCM10010521_54210 [Streptomyces rameus]|uniref:DUF3558 domain-containing protein n=1 Tax=Streptomyces rameus TaxID=68261 RepID=A0ABN3UYI3_9ACTN